MIKKISIGVGILISILVVFGVWSFIASVKQHSFSSAPMASIDSPQGLPSSYLRTKYFKEQGRGFAAPEMSLQKNPSLPANPKKIIRNASLSLVIDNAQEAISKITAVAESNKGFVESLERREDEAGAKYASLTLRVPVESFSDTLEKIKNQARIVEAEQITGQDVTEEYIDLQARFKNFQATEAQYLEILKKAYSIEDILKVTQPLSEVRGQIESLQGQLKYLANQTDLATIRVSLSEEPTISLSLKDFRPLTVLKVALKALVEGLIIIFNILVTVIIVWLPIIIVAGALVIIIGILAWKVLRKVKNKLLWP